VQLTIDDKPINNEFVSEVNAIFQLGGSYADLCEQLAYVCTVHTINHPSDTIAF
jgi:hypothetical protein